MSFCMHDMLVSVGIWPLPHEHTHHILKHKILSIQYTSYNTTTICKYLLALILYYKFVFKILYPRIEIDCRNKFWYDNKCVVLTNSTFVYTSSGKLHFIVLT